MVHIFVRKLSQALVGQCPFGRMHTLKIRQLAW